MSTFLSTIPKQYHADIWAKAEYGESVSSINVWLKEKGILVNDRTIYRLLKDYREEKQAITKAVYAQEVLAKAHGDLAIVDEMINSLFACYQERLDKEDHKNALQYANALEKYISFRKNLMSGDETQANVPTSPVIDQLLQKLQAHVSNATTDKIDSTTAIITAEVISPKPESN